MKIDARELSVALACPVRQSFRVAKVAGLVDFDPPERLQLDIRAHVPPIDGPGSDWKIGAIIGPSGEGKSTIAREAFGDRFIERFDWPADASILDGFPADLQPEQIIGTLTAAGFSSIPPWFQPYQTLSNGQRFRADLARALLQDWPVVAVDEFGGTVDNTVAQTTAAAVSKAIRAGKCRARRFVAVGARGDFADYLQPDWVLDMSSRTLARGWVQRDRRKHPRWFAGRPRLRFDLVRLDPGGGLRLWPLFARHHYLTARIHPGARCYAALLLPGRQPVGFIATNQTPGRKRSRLVHRLVVLPDYQGVGLGSRLLEAVADIEGRTHSIGIRTSHPALISLLHRGGRSGRWYCADLSRQGSRQTGLDALGKGARANSFGRPVATFRCRV